MLKLDSYLPGLDKSIIDSPNLCDRFSDDDLKRIGTYCHTGWQRDEASRMVWMERNEAGMDLALQIYKDKSFPWPGCANVAFPLVTIAAMQFHARAYPSLISGTDVVKCAVVAPDKGGVKQARADRISTHMSWQVLYEDKAWEEQEDKAILNLSIVGTCFKKSYYSAQKAHNVSDLVLAKDLVLDYWARSVEDCPRKTHLIPKFRNEIYEAVVRGIWRDVLEESWYKGLPTPRVTTAKVNQDNRQGVQPPAPDESSAFLFGEQHCWMDLDDDGFAEPYIITFETQSQTVVRIVSRIARIEDVKRAVSGNHRGKIYSITAEEYFTKKSFIPSPDGGIYDIGFGVFLGPLNEAVNSIVNMLLDCGTLQTTGGGFLARGAKIRGGTYTVAPFEWKRVDSTGDDLRKSIYPLPMNQPSDVLFQLLSLLINYTSRVSGTTDTLVGENPGQNTPAQTTQTMVEMGQKIYNAIFKRVWRATKEEFEKLYKLNARFMQLDREYPGGATREDYLGDPREVRPVADPHITSDSQRLQLAITLKQAAATTPGYNHDAVERRFLKALRVDDAEQLFPGTQGIPPQEDKAVTVAKIKEEGANQRAMAEFQMRSQENIMQLMEDRRLNNAKIVELMAKADEAAANAESEMAYAQVAMINAELASVKHENDAINEQINHLLKAAEIYSRHKIGTSKKAA